MDARRILAIFRKDFSDAVRDSRILRKSIPRTQCRRGVLSLGASPSSV